ncbi:MAG: hypothetical protein Q4C23_02850 [Mycoplasmatota bacterium]|nr:hypothetical protein [Mycoplasmatota bacterium]
MKDKMMEKDIEKLLRGAKTKIIVTNKGMGLDGNLLELLGLLGCLIYKMKTSGIDETMLKEVVEIALNIDEEETEKNNQERKNTKSELKKLIKGLNEALTKDLENLVEILGDDENE